MSTVTEPFRNIFFCPTLFTELENFAVLCSRLVHCKYLNAWFECNDIVISIYSHYPLDPNAKSSDTKGNTFSIRWFCIRIERVMTVYGNYDVIAFRSCIQIFTVYIYQNIFIRIILLISKFIFRHHLVAYHMVSRIPNVIDFFNESWKFGIWDSEFMKPWTEECKEIWFLFRIETFWLFSYCFGYIFSSWYWTLLFLFLEYRF